MTRIVNVTTESASIRHLNGIVECHLESFKGFFLSFLGKDFLKLLYSEVIRSNLGFGVVLQENKKVVGFAIGTKQISGFYKRLLLRRGLKFFVLSLGPMIRKPSITLRLFRALFIHKQAKNYSSKNSLLSLAVRNSFQKRGFGSKLISAFLVQARNGGINDIFLTTDAHENDSTNRFYIRNGFKLINSFTTPEGRAMNEYYISLLF